MYRNVRVRNVSGSFIILKNARVTWVLEVHLLWVLSCVKIQREITEFPVPLKYIYRSKNHENRKMPRHVTF